MSTSRTYLIFVDLHYECYATFPTWFRRFIASLAILIFNDFLFFIFYFFIIQLLKVGEGDLTLGSLCKRGYSMPLSYNALGY